MDAQFMIYSGEGKELGLVKLTLNFSEKTWTIVEDPKSAWPGASKAGSIDIPAPRQMTIRDSVPGKPLVISLITFGDFPNSESDTGSAGVGSISSGGYAFTIRTSPQLSAIRAKMISILDQVPDQVGSISNAQLFQELTDLTQAVLVANWNGTAPNASLFLTSCNAFLGKTARRLGARPGSHLASGILDLQRCDRDVKGSFVWAKGELRPRVGDFYAVSEVNRYHDLQQFGHVGTVAKINSDGTWMAVDGGQGRVGAEDFVKRVPKGSLATTNFTGWCDIDIYFGNA